MNISQISAGNGGKMSSNEEIEEPLKEEVRKDLIEYYKWIVNLATFVLTISISATWLFECGIKHKGFLVFGWALLGFCIFLNWLIVKRLVTIPIVYEVSKQKEGFHRRIFKDTIKNIKIYGFIQIRRCPLYVQYPNDGRLSPLYQEGWRRSRRGV